MELGRKSKILLSFSLLLSLVMDETVAEAGLCAVKRLPEILEARMLPDHLTLCQLPWEFAQTASGGCNVSKHLAGATIDCQMPNSDIKNDYISPTERESFSNGTVFMMKVWRKDCGDLKQFGFRYNDSEDVYHDEEVHAIRDKPLMLKNLYFLLCVGCSLLLLGLVFWPLVLVPARVQQEFQGPPSQQVNAAPPFSDPHRFHTFYFYGAIASTLGLLIFLIHLLHQKYFKR